MARLERQAILIADLSYGDAGKGSIVDYLTRQHQAHTVVRYNGGAQAAHNVVEESGRHHTFAQFGSGTFTPGTRTHLSRFVLIHPLSMLKEEQHLQSIGIDDAFQRTSIDEDALIITPFQQAANRLQEIARANTRHGSCGMGVGETMQDFLAYGPQVLFARDLAQRATVRKKLRFLRDLKRSQIEKVQGQLPDTEQVRQELKTLHDPEIIDDCADLYQHFASLVAIVDERYFNRLLDEPGTIIFEGAQGVLLDEWYGFHPYTTWSTTTFKNAKQLLHEYDYKNIVTRIGVLRAYTTRHGAGPFVTEDAWLSASLPDAHNENNPWQQAFRVGYLDLVATRYALDVAGPVDALAVTNLDRLASLPAWKLCNAYYYQAADEAEIAPYFEAQGSSMKAIKVHQPANLTHQEQLTQHLWRCTPHYATIHPSRTLDTTNREGVYQYLAQIEQSLKCPIAIASFGPTASDKMALPSHES
jgi:adenylosuccinate synthase